MNLNMDKEEVSEDVLTLPAPVSSTILSDTTNTENSTTASLEDLGPVILNSDGTMSRIPNWKDLTDIEKDKTFRLITKRNAKRKQELEQLQE